MNLCACGCGLEPKQGNKYLWGHTNKGRKKSPETIAKLKAALNNPEIKAKHKAGTKRSANRPEFKEALRKANLGKTLSEEHRRKISEANKGKVVAEEVKKRIADSLKGRFLGEKNPYFKHGKSSRNRAIRQTYDYQKWRKDVFERDDFTCRGCGVRGVYITAHHIKSFAYHPDLRFDLDNGLTLCEPCHEKTDNYKRKNKQIK
jgi:hypothetical protein